MDDIEKNAAKMQLEGLLDTLTDAKEYGSILNVESYNWDLLRRFVAAEDTDGQISMDSVGVEDTAEQLNRLIDIGETMARKYWVTCTNPPYAGTSNLSVKLNNYVKKHYSDSKADMFAVLIERCSQFVLKCGFQSMITQHAWMFINSYESLRKKIYEKRFLSLVHLGIKAFEEIGNDVVQTCAFVIQGKYFDGYNSQFVRLVDCKNYNEKEKAFLTGKYRFEANIADLKKIPGMPLAYWVSKQFIRNFQNAKYIEDYGILTGSQNITGDNEKFLKCFWEVDNEKVGDRWHFYAKGGDYRQYYGNLTFVVDWSDTARTFYATNKTSNLLSEEFWYKPGITYSAITSRGTGFRYLPEGCIFDKGGPSINLRSNIPEILALLNTNVAKYYFWVFNPSINLQVKDVKSFPIILPENPLLTEMADTNLKFCEYDWNAFETSWEFKHHPLVTAVCVKSQTDISSCFEQWKADCQKHSDELKTNEEKLNSIFIDAYGLQGEVEENVEERDVTVRKADLQRDIKSLLSYAVGCMFGRYSTYKDGLLFAGEPYSLQAFVDKLNDRPGTISAEELQRAYRNEGVVVDEMFFPDADNVIPITDEEYLDDDIVSRLCAWLKAAYGADTLEANLDYIAKALGNKGSTSREIIRNYFLNDFFKDHCQTYSVTGSGKRPIYWLFDSGKQNGFKALVYLHRYTPDTIGNLRIDYLHKMQRVYESEINRMQDMMDHSENAREVAAASKRKDKLAKQLKECREYDEKISHLALSRIELDLDDGVKVNYRKLQTAQDGKFYEVLADSKNIMVKEKK